MIRGILHNRNSVRKFPKQKNDFSQNKILKKKQTTYKKIQKIIAKKKRESRANTTARKKILKTRLFIVILIVIVIQNFIFIFRITNKNELYTRGLKYWINNLHHDRLSLLWNSSINNQQKQYNRKKNRAKILFYYTFW